MCMYGVDGCQSGEYSRHTHSQTYIQHSNRHSDAFHETGIYEQKKDEGGKERERLVVAVCSSSFTDTLLDRHIA